MSRWVREGEFDLIVAAAPGMLFWPTVGGQSLSSICAEFDLRVGVFGGESLQVIGALPMPETGAVVIVQDIQNRIHRLQTRSLVRISPYRPWPDPFKNGRSPALIPLSTAKKIRVGWFPAVVILGTGNAALRMGSSILEKGNSRQQVYCLESRGHWGEKGYAGWEVEKRRFETLGGKIIFGRPLSLIQKAAMLWEFRIQDSTGVRIIDTSWVISAGPFDDFPRVKEYPQGSMLFDFASMAPEKQEDDVEGWNSEQHRAELLAAKIIRSLKGELSKDEREYWDHLHKRAKMRIKKLNQHHEKPFASFYQGKWISALSAQYLKGFSGAPQKVHKERMVASIDCYENISCNICEKKCPESAIELTSARDRVLSEDLCTACGICLQVCPSGAVVMLEEREGSFSKVVFPVRQSLQGIEEKGFVQLLNRRGDFLANARVYEVKKPEKEGDVVRVGVEVPSHLLWEARGIRRVPLSSANENILDAMSIPAQERVEVTLLGERRLVRDSALLSEVLFETGRMRAQDVLMCKDGSCGLCFADVDGVKKKTCQTQVHKGMVVKTMDNSRSASTSADQASLGEVSDGLLCPCLRMSSEQLLDKIKQGELMSADAIVDVTGIGSGKCHGQLCMGAFRRILADQSVPGAEEWVDWRFPWMDWVLVPNPPG